jgi:hypothetical protein
MTESTATKVILGNKIITEFIAKEAREQVAFDIRKKTGSGTTEKGVSVLLMNGNDKSIAKRYSQYFSTGIAAVVMIKMDMA